MKFDNPYFGVITDRYKRFLSDITLDSGDEVNAHVPNTGAMTTCWDKNWKVLLSKSDNPKRKLAYTLELTHNGSTWICVNTSRTNKLAQEALENNVIKELIGYKTLKAEAKIYDSRLDFFLSDHETLSDVYVEVKNVTLLGPNDFALFPDSKSTRAQKHINDLVKIKESGLRAVMLYVVNREDVHLFSVAKEIDPIYAQLVKEAKEKGVEFLAYQAKITDSEIYIDKKIKVVI